MNSIVGYSGFVGSNLLQFYKFNDFYNSKNFDKAKNKSFDTMFFCGIPAVKWYANKHPKEDEKTIENIKEILDSVNVKKFILISTIDVYDDINREYDEDYNINHKNNHTYGKNRFLFEQYVKDRFIDHHIIRLPGLFGKGLKKNIIYDLIKNNNVEKIPLNSSFQWYSLDWLKKDIELILKNNIRTCNLFTEPLHTSDIIKLYEKVFNIDYSFNLEYFGDNNKFVGYNTTTKYGYLYDKEKYIRNKKEILDELEIYLNFEKLDKSNLSISNICVNSVSQLQFSCILKLYGIKNVQVAPTKLISDWNDINNIDFSIFTNNGIKIKSLQSITYTLNNLNIFDNNTSEKLLNHIKKVIDVAENKGIDFLVFGCPRNRKILNNEIDNNTIFINFFKKIGDYLEGKNLKIYIENNSKKYNCNFINNIKQLDEIINKINKENIKMMIDLGNCIMEDDEWYYVNDYLINTFNIDISNPNMNDFSSYHKSNNVFKLLLKDLKKNINLEMLIKNEKNELSILIESINNFINLYSK